MDLPPGITLPQGMQAVQGNDRLAKRIERIRIELTNLFDRVTREHELATLEEKWTARERESLSRRLAIHEIIKQHGPTRTMQIVTLRMLPKDMNDRAEVFRANAAYRDLVKSYRAKFGSSPQNQPAKGPVS